jgi:DNA polymerase-3 subunit epsilon
VTAALKNLTLSRRLAAFDLESTGVDPATDRIVEVAVLTLSPVGPASLFHSRVNPGRPIPAAATAVHRIADADVAGAPRFREIAAELARRLDGCDLAGFGIGGFDLPLLAAEFARSGVPFHMAGRAVLDALAVFRRWEPRSLSAAVAFYLGREHAGAHSATQDVGAAVEVLDEQVRRYGLPVTPDSLHAAIVEVDVAGKFRRADGGPAFAFGKYAGRLLGDVAASDPGYLKWILGRAFLPDVHALVRAALAAADTAR